MDPPADTAFEVDVDDDDDLATGPLDERVYVVVRGYQPGCTDRLHTTDFLRKTVDLIGIIRFGVVLSAKGINGALVLRMQSEAAAIRRWRWEVLSGNRVACLGTARVEEVF